MVVDGGRSVAEVARKLGVNENMLYRWKRQYVEDSEYAFPGKGRMKALEEAVGRLEREFADVREERDILKKALTIFSKGPG